MNTVCLKLFRDAQTFKISLFLETPLKRRGSGRSFETDLDLRAAHLVFEQTRGKTQQHATATTMTKTRTMTT